MIMISLIGNVGAHFATRATFISDPGPRRYVIRTRHFRSVSAQSEQILTICHPHS